MMPPPPQMVPLWRLWLHAASERARAASQRTARARWGGDRATRSVDGSGDGTGVGSGVIVVVPRIDYNHRTSTYTKVRHRFTRENLDLVLNLLPLELTP